MRSKRETGWVVTMDGWTFFSSFCREEGEERGGWHFTTSLTNAFVFPTREGARKMVDFIASFDFIGSKGERIPAESFNVRKLTDAEINITKGGLK